MKILVCIKQVPGTNKVEVDPVTGVLKRDGAEAKMNPYDLYAIEAALKIKEKVGGNAFITAITMGPNQAADVIREAYMMGVDDGYVFSDRKFAGSDVLATSWTLSQGIGVIGDFDIIICGKQTTDGDTAQVGPAIAEYLGIPHTAWVKRIDSVDQNSIVVEQDFASFTQTAEMKYPCLITVEKGILQPRLPSYRLKIATKDRPVKMVSLYDFADKNESHYGLKGSATSVERIFPPEVNTGQIFVMGSPKEQGERIFELLGEKKFI